MINHIWSVLCEKSILDQDTKLISLINAVEELTITEEPGPEKKIGVVLSLVTLWARSDPSLPEKGYSRYNFAAPSGNLIQNLDSDIDLTKYERLRFRGQFAGIPVPEAGQYQFHVEYRENDQQDWKRVASIPLKISYKSK